MGPGPMGWAQWARAQMGRAQMGRAQRARAQMGRAQWARAQTNAATNAKTVATNICFISTRVFINARWGLLVTETKKYEYVL